MRHYAFKSRPYHELRNFLAVIELSPLVSTTTGFLVLFVGKRLNRELKALRDYSIPEPVSGGLLVARNQVELAKVPSLQCALSDLGISVQPLLEREPSQRTQYDDHAGRADHQDGGLIHAPRMTAAPGLDVTDV